VACDGSDTSAWKLRYLGDGHPGVAWSPRTRWPEQGGLPKGHPEIVEMLNRLLVEELTATDRYMIHSRVARE